MCSPAGDILSPARLRAYGSRFYISTLTLVLIICALYFAGFDIGIAESRIRILLTFRELDRLVRTCMHTGQTQFTFAARNRLFDFDSIIRTRTNAHANATAYTAICYRKPLFCFCMNAIRQEDALCALI